MVLLQLNIKKQNVVIIMIMVVYGRMSLKIKLSVVPQLKSGFSGKVHPALLMMTLAA